MSTKTAKSAIAVGLLMKHIHLSALFTLTMMLGLSACQEKKKSTSSSSNTVATTTTTTGGFSGGFTSGTTTGSTSGSGTTTGTTSGTSGTTGGGGGLNSPFVMYAAMSGNGIACEPGANSACDSWFPGLNPSSRPGVTIGDFYTIVPGNIGFFASDSQYRVRVTVLDQPTIAPATNSPVCYNRANGAQPYYRYTKVQFKVAVRDVIANTGNCTTATSYVLGARYNSRLSEQVPVNATNTFDFSQSLNRAANVCGHVMEILDVQADNSVCSSPTNCTSVGAVSSFACWSMKVELDTDDTTDF